MRRYTFLVVFLAVLALAWSGCSRPSQNAEQPAPGAQADQSSPQNPDNPGLKTRSSTDKSGAANTQPAAKPLVIPEGTELTIRMAQSVGSKTSQPGETFNATVADAVMVNGIAAIPEGAEITGHVAEAVPLGRFKGGARLRLAIDKVDVKGKSYPLQASLSRTAKGKGKRTAVMAGGGAGLGAIIGGIAGGGKGAAIGALAGGGAGTAGAAFTGNKDIVVPAESALTFRLQQPVEMK